MLLGVISDIHGNAGALVTALEWLWDRGAERIVALGDTIGYVPSVDALRQIRKAGIPCLRGNHEDMLLAGCWTDEQDAVYRFTETSGLLEGADQLWLEKLPESLDESIDGYRFLFVHGSPVDRVHGYVYPDTDLDGVLPPAGVDVVFMGNTHRPFVREHDGRLFVNVGSCGFPRDDLALGSACLFDYATLDAEILRFPIGNAARDLLQRFRLHPSVESYLHRYIEAENVHDCSGLG